MWYNYISLITSLLKKKKTLNYYLAHLEQCPNFLVVFEVWHC